MWNFLKRLAIITMVGILISVLILGQDDGILKWESVTETVRAGIQNITDVSQMEGYLLQYLPQLHQFANDALQQIGLGGRALVSFLWEEVGAIYPEKIREGLAAFHVGEKEDWIRFDLLEVLGRIENFLYRG